MNWTDIQEISIYEFMGQKFIGLKLEDTDHFMSQQSGLKKWLMRMNKGMVQAPVNIAQSAISISLEELYVMMVSTWQRARE
ncbi:STM3941 family protein [Paenibacillus castaneae]|uniref:STM3941 family protein n=1 Tax=Paenibacillus castaneae TaxID=474957 RepID=UPI00244429F0|nr:STM3941 family protein [Paenibacillus castaneae]